MKGGFMRWLIPIVIVLCSLGVMPLNARTINIPSDYENIQDGIDASFDGDTVLVQQGIYRENINFAGRNIILCSKFLINTDTSSIDSTIIDGNFYGTAVSFTNHEDSMAALIGFTIMNGRSGTGGGILCNQSSPRILWNIISYNSSSGWYGGAGIFCDSLSNPAIQFNRIHDNYASIYGGGISCKSANPVISHNVIYRNEADM
jgi:hypothetical protein